jgi:hypothetical protein
MKPIGGNSVNTKSGSGSWVILKKIGGNPVICCYFRYKDDIPISNDLMMTQD